MSENGIDGSKVYLDRHGQRATSDAMVRDRRQKRRERGGGVELCEFGGGWVRKGGVWGSS